MINSLMTITNDVVGFVNEEFEKKGIKILKEKKSGSSNGTGTQHRILLLEG